MTVTDLRGTTQVSANDWELPLDGVPRRYWSQRGSTIENRIFAIDPAGRLAAEQAASPSSFQLGALDLPAGATSTAQASMTSARTSYALDGRNNWTSRTSAGVTTSYAQDARDALLSVGAQTITTDALGAITNDGSHRYTYDALGLVSEVRPVGSNGGRRYQRDALGRVVTETDIASGAITRFAWDGAQRVFVQRPTGAVETTLAAEGLDQPVVTIFPGGARRYFHQDRQGSVYAQTDDAGVAQLWLSYSAYGDVSLRDAAGRALPAAGVLPNFGYHGLPHDFGLGLVDMRARVYRPSLGRFLSPDPIKLAGGANLFAFVNSGPMTWRDPLGLKKAEGRRRVDADHDGLLEFEEMFRFGQHSTVGAEQEVYVGIIVGHALGNADVRVGDQAWRWMQASVAFGLSRDFGDRARFYKDQVDEIGQRKPILTTGSLGTMLTSDYAALERQLAFEVNMTALAGGPAGAVLQALGAPELGVAVNELALAWGGVAQVKLFGNNISDYTTPYYIPREASGQPIPLASQRVSGQDLPLPDPRAEGRPHTVLGGRLGSDGVTYRQSATFPGPTWPLANGQLVPWSRVDWHDHGRANDHSIPHQHPYLYNRDQRRWEQSELPEPVR